MDRKPNSNFKILNDNSNFPQQECLKPYQMKIFGRCYSISQLNLDVNDDVIVNISDVNKN